MHVHAFPWDKVHANIRFSVLIFSLGKAPGWKIWSSDITQLLYLSSVILQNSIIDIWTIWSIYYYSFCWIPIKIQKIITLLVTQSLFSFSFWNEESSPTIMSAENFTDSQMRFSYICINLVNNVPLNIHKRSV